MATTPTAQARPPRSDPVLALAIAAICLFAGPAHGGPIARELDRLIRARVDLGPATVAVHVRDAATGQTLYESPDARTESGDPRPLLPASNMKLLTTAAALHALGPEFIFETRLAATGSRLVVIGDGDPGLGDPALLQRADPAFDVSDLLEALATTAAERMPGGISEIVVDDRVFDRVWAHPSWPEDQLNRWYCAEVGGVNVHTNVLTFLIEGSDTVGTAPRLEVVPAGRAAPWLEISNRARTTASGRSALWIARPTPQNSFTLRGSIAAGRAASVDVTLHQPPLVMGHLLAGRLDLPNSAVRLARPGESFGQTRDLVLVRTALVDVLERANADSQNMYTEALIKRIGHEATGQPGSWGNGADAIRVILADRLGPGHAAGTRIADGSGLSRLNAVSAQTLTAWLASFATDSRLGPAYVESLPEPGEGTLRRRFRGDRLETEVRAKSGSINGVRCLSGLVIAQGPRRILAFSILVNDLPRGEAELRAKDLHEDIVAALDEHLAGDSAAEPQIGG